MRLFPCLLFIVSFALLMACDEEVHDEYLAVGYPYHFLPADTFTIPVEGRGGVLTGVYTETNEAIRGFLIYSITGRGAAGDTLFWRYDSRTGLRDSEGDTLDGWYLLRAEGNLLYYQIAPNESGERRSISIDTGVGDVFSDILIVQEGGGVDAAE